ncbi:MAG: hypothetical protein QGI68_18500 [Pseudomonadales bacterium]|nr:hypothetical protein [Pseudomonadales bacterium]MDP7359431.1 hypothetical protein [Pseudomonadales bacterium]MDP7597536.1 hypothetical protein [Pseudomonadales bacterium]HJN51021.1 hypothetical protein [Pseudomonadales bacterium]
MDYLIAIVATPLLMVFWAVVQLLGDGNDEVPEEYGGRCIGCTCARDLDSCERP